jgi:hypothetical protein
MQLADLSKNQRFILQMLDRDGPLTRGQIKAEAVPAVMAEGNVSSALNRLESYGLVQAPEKLGGPWRITAAGAALFEAPDAPITVTAPVGVPETDHIVEVTNMVESPDDDPDDDPEPESAEVSLDVRVEQALWEFRARMKSAYAVPEKTLYVYHSVLADLPPALQEQLDPLTRRLSVQP